MNLRRWTQMGPERFPLLGDAAQGSLGALMEKEVEDIIKVCVSKNETTIHWHEFVAVSLSHCHCKVGERNLRLAFNRIDYIQEFHGLDRKWHSAL